MFGVRAIDASPPTDVSGGLLAYALSAPRHLLMSVQVSGSLAYALSAPRPLPTSVQVSGGLAYALSAPRPLLMSVEVLEFSLCAIGAQTGWCCCVIGCF